MVSWTQAVCAQCYTAWSIGFHESVVKPVVMTNAETEQCCMCGKDNDDGIYVRVNPNVVPYPSNEEGDGDGT